MTSPEFDVNLAHELEIKVRRMLRLHGKVTSTDQREPPDTIETTLVLEEFTFCKIERGMRSGVSITSSPVAGGLVVHYTTGTNNPDPLIIMNDPEFLRTRVIPMIDKFMVLDDLAGV